MAVAATSLTSGTDAVDNTSFSTASVSPTANRLVLIAITNSSISPGGNVDPTGVSGAGLTFTKVASIAESGQYGNVTLWRALSASPSSGAITITFASTTENCSWSVIEFSGIDTGGTNGSAAIVQAVTAENTSSSTPSATLAAFGSANNATYGAFGCDNFTGGGRTCTAGTGFTEYHDVYIDESSFGGGTFTEFRADNDTSVDCTWSTTNAWNGVIAVEIKDAGGGTTYYQTNSGSITLSASLVKQTNTGRTAGSTTMSGTLSTAAVFGKLVEGSVTMAGSVLKNIGKSLEGSLTMAGSVVRQTEKMLGGTLSVAGSLLKEVSRVLTGSVTMQGGVAAAWTTTKALAGSIAMSGAVSGIKMATIVYDTINRTGAFLRRHIGRR